MLWCQVSFSYLQEGATSLCHGILWMSVGSTHPEGNPEKTLPIFLGELQYVWMPSLLFIGTILFLFCFLFFSISYPFFSLSCLTRRRFYPQRASGQAMVTGVYPSPPPVRAFIFVAHRVQHYHCSSIFIECS